MIILDTDHVSVLQRESDTADTLATRLLESGEDIATTIITLEEQTKSWISRLGRESDVAKQVAIYRRLLGMLEFFANWKVTTFSSDAASEFQRIRSNRVRIATTDLKIASIALVTNSILLTANTVDFERVPNLRFEFWI